MGAIHFFDVVMLWNNTHANNFQEWAQEEFFSVQFLLAFFPVFSNNSNIYELGFRIPCDEELLPDCLSLVF